MYATRGVLLTAAVAATAVDLFRASLGRSAYGAHGLDNRARVEEFVSSLAGHDQGPLGLHSVWIGVACKSYAVRLGGRLTYRVLVDDNGHYMDESERYELGEFETLEAAVAACKKLVDEFLTTSHRPGMTSAELLKQYSHFGEDPFVDAGAGTVPFSARSYAAARVREICGDAETDQPGR